MTIRLLPALVVALTIVWGGCYTRIATVHPEPLPHPAGEHLIMPDSAAIDTLEGDSAAMAQQAAAAGRKDTLVVIDKRDPDQNCFWTRNWRGEPVLRCHTTTTSLHWYSYHHTPWWHRNHYGYSYDFNRCPPYYYYDPYTGFCRFHRDYNRYYYPRSYRSGGSSGTGGSSGGSVDVRRQPRDAGIRSTGGHSAPVASPKTAPPAPRTGTTKPPAASPRRSRTDGVAPPPAPQQPAPQPAPEAAPKSSPQTQPSQSPPPDEEEKKRDESPRRNPRSF